MKIHFYFLCAFLCTIGLGSCAQATSSNPEHNSTDFDVDSSGNTDSAPYIDEPTETDSQTDVGTEINTDTNPDTDTLEDTDTRSDNDTDTGTDNDTDTADDPVPWTPAEITTEMWFDASDYSTITESGGVSGWADKSGNNRDVAQPKTSLQPVYNATGLGGKPTLEFREVVNPRGKAMGRNVASDGLPITDYSLFVVVNDLSLDNENWLLTTPMEDSKENRWVLGTGGPGVRSDNFNGGDDGSATFIPGEQQLYFNLSGSCEVRRDGTQVAGPNAAYTPKKFTDNFSIGARNWHLDGHAGMNADLSEFIYIAGTPSTEIRQKVEGYLAWKWGLEGSLPGDHPYKFKPPSK